MSSKAVLLAILLVMLPFGMLGMQFIASVGGTPEIIREVPTPEYLTIQAAIDAAHPGDIIKVASGIYSERIVVNKSLTLVGENRETTILDGGGLGIVVRINAPDVEVRGFTVQNGGESPNILLGSCIRNVIRECIIRDSAYGIELHGTNASVVVDNTVTNCSWAGIIVRDSSNNTIYGNSILNNSIGVHLTSEFSRFNMFYYNNFIENLDQARDFAWETRWDNSAEGNYWSDYQGEDIDGDGIGDTLLPWGVDWHPLIERWSPIRRFAAGTWDGVTYYVTTLSNSTVASFNFSKHLKRVSFNVTSGGAGFCNVTIPVELLRGYFSVYINYEQVPVLFTTKNSTHTFLYFSYGAGTHYIEIEGTIVIPEFPWESMPLFLIFLAILFVFILSSKGAKTIESHKVKPKLSLLDELL